MAADASSLPGRIVHGLVQRATALGLRQADDVAQERLLLRELGMARKQSGERIEPGLVVRSRRQVHETDDDFAGHLAPLGHAEVQHEAGMTGEAGGQRAFAQFADEPRLADAGVATDEHGPSGAARRATRERRRKLRELRGASDERMRSASAPWCRRTRRSAMR